MRKLGGALAVFLLLVLAALQGSTGKANAGEAGVGDAYLYHRTDSEAVKVAVCRSLSTDDPYPMCAMSYGGGGANAHRYLYTGHSTKEFGWGDTDAVWCGEGYKLWVLNGGPGPDVYDCRGSGIGNAPGTARLVKISGCLGTCTKSFTVLRD